MGEKNPPFTCPNPSCKTTFRIPLKTLNLQDDPTEPYNACPICLTKLDDAKIETPQLNTKKEYEKQKNLQLDNACNKASKPSSCNFHLGYLSERGQKDGIPDDCLVCKSIVDCMLKRVHGEQ